MFQFLRNQTKEKVNTKPIDYILTVLVVLLFIVSFIMIIVVGAKDKTCCTYGIFVGIALGMMIAGAFGMNIVSIHWGDLIGFFCIIFFASLWNRCR